jgi:hypothetical protein
MGLESCHVLVGSTVADYSCWGTHACKGIEYHNNGRNVDPSTNIKIGKHSCDGDKACYEMFSVVTIKLQQS